MPQGSFSNNWFTTLGQAFLSAPGGMAAWGSEQVRSRSTYNVDPEPYSASSETECPQSCGICHPRQRNSDAYFDGDGGSYLAKKPTYATATTSDKWFNQIGATSGEPLPWHENSGGIFPVWWDELWYGKNSTIEQVMFSIQELTEVVAPQNQRS